MRIPRKTTAREQQHQAFGKYLLQRHGNPAPDKVAIRFGRYLQAARRSAGLSRIELAAKSGLSLALLLALEQGVISSHHIKGGWLTDLAIALEESIDDFRLLLGRNLAGTNSTATTGWTAILSRLRFPSLSVGFKPVYTAVSAMLMCLLFGAMLQTRSPLPSEPVPDLPVGQPLSTLIDVRPESRLNVVRAEIKAVPPEIPLLLPTLLNISAENRLNLLKAESGLVHNQPLPVRPQPTLPLLPTLIQIAPENRLNMINAELRLESQVYILRTLINISTNERLNLIKAEHRL